MENTKQKLNEKIYWSVFFILMILKYGYYRFQYYPVIDDWIQYGVYTLPNNIFKDVILKVRTYTTRPLASLSDPYIWGQFWDKMNIPFLIITFLHFISCYFIYEIFKKNKTKIGYVFLILYGIMPLGVEATYWISASSRLILGMFFLSMGLYFLSKHFEKQKDSYYYMKKTYLWLFFMSHLISFCYYEQIISLGFIAAYILILGNVNKIKEKITYFIPLINLFLIGAYYYIFSKTGNVSQRGQLVDSQFSDRAEFVWKNIKMSWIEPSVSMYGNGFQRGIAILMENRSYIYGTLIILGAILTFYVRYKEKEEVEFSLAKIFLQFFLGFLLFFVVYAPFFVLKTGNLYIRNAFPSFIGFALMVEAILGILLNKYKILKIIDATLLSLVVGLFLVVSVTKLTDYKNVSLKDQQIAKDVLTYCENTDVLNGENLLVIFNNKGSYVRQKDLSQSSNFGDHIVNATGSDWAFTGLLRATAKTNKIKYIIPIPNQSVFKNNKEIWEEYVLLGLDESGEVLKLKKRIVSPSLIELLDENRRVFGQVQIKEEGQAEFIKVNK